MKIKRGTHRIVIITKHLTIKLPKAWNPWFIVKDFLKRRKIHVALAQIKNLTNTIMWGIKENWNEYQCWRENKANFLVPVYFCIGIIEIQKTDHSEEPAEEEISHIWGRLLDISDNEVHRTDAHSLSSPSNYRKTETQLRLVDYGGANMRKFVRRYCRELEDLFSSPRT